MYSHLFSPRRQSHIPKQQPILVVERRQSITSAAVADTLTRRNDSLNPRAPLRVCFCPCTQRRRRRHFRCTVCNRRRAPFARPSLRPPSRSRRETLCPYHLSLRHPDGYAATTLYSPWSAFGLRGNLSGAAWRELCWERAEHCWRGCSQVSCLGRVRESCVSIWEACVVIGV